MKHLTIIAIALFLTLLLFNSCSENTTNTSDNIQKISATINGASWVSTKNYLNQELGTSRKILRIQGENNDEKIELVMQFLPFDTIKTVEYSLSHNGEFFAIYYHNNKIDTAFSGKVDLKEYNYNDETGNLKAKGNFNFIVNSNSGNYTIKDGYFFTPGN